MKKLLLVLISCSLLNAESVNHQEQEYHKLFDNKTIMVIGGTGYLGRAIVHELFNYQPKKIIVLSRDEVKQFHLNQQFKNNPKLVTMLGDIRDYHTVLNATKNVDIVFHVAALKRIESVEHNVEEGVKTNVIGSLNVYHACLANEVQKVLFMSTDKACWPINAYGATKFISEKIFTNHTGPSKTTFVVARFGNILESTGSIIPIFTQKITNGENIPLTDHNMTRFIITKEEAVKTLFSALRYGVGGEVFVTKLDSLKIIDLIELLKNKHNATNNITTIGLRPGEKIHETLINSSEISRTYEFDNYYVICPSVARELISRPIYMEQGKKLDESHMTEYSSHQAILNKNDLSSVFKKIGLL